MGEQEEMYLFRSFVGFRLKLTHANLIREAEFISTLMQALAERLRSKRAVMDLHVNWLGELQQRGAVLDRLCAEFCVYQSILEWLDKEAGAGGQEGE